MLLTTSRCVLRPWRLDDAAALAAEANDPRIAAQTRDVFPNPYTLADAQAFLASAVDEEPPTRFAITVDDVVAGGIGWIPGTDVSRVTAEVGYWLGTAWWGRGIAQDALAAVSTALLRPGTGFERLEAIVFVGNDASARVLERCGYVQEAVMRRSAIKHGVVRDQYLYARVRDRAPEP
ncbi:MAG: GNAT family N-acetyltransferase [Gemmatimonadaceae bacterium]|nr:GNAT family N-acetyltransferase [Gemmatimonadaceae bacterium]